MPAPPPDRRSRTALLLLLLAGAAVARADDAAIPAPVLRLRVGDVALTPATNLLSLPGSRFEPNTAYVIALSGPMDPARQAALDALGVATAGYLPDHAFIATFKGTRPADLAALGFVAWVGQFRTEWKVAPSVREARNWQWRAADRAALAAQGRQALRVFVFPFAGNAPLRDLPGVDVLADQTTLGQRELVIIGTMGVEDALAALPAVQCVEPVAEYTLRSNSTTRWVVQSNVQGVTPFYDRGITGVGQIVGIIDGPIGASHCSFLDAINPIGPLHRKIAAYNTALSYNLHGTHVAGTAVGDAGIADNTRGIAWGARLVYNNHPDMSEQSMFGKFELHHTQGARVHTNSWGTDAFRDYDGGARAIDAFSFQYEDDLVLFAITDFSPFVMNPENAKNCLAVFATSNSPSQANWCFGGSAPTLDGRQKPEVGAPGCSILSSSGSSGCAITSQTGTSMACPAVAGLATLVRDYYTRGFYPSGVATPANAFTPSGSLIKATVINSAVDLTGVPGFPSAREGWGRVLGDNAVYFQGDASASLVRDVRSASPGALQTGLESSVRVAVGAASRPLKITLTWADFPAVVNAQFTPVNNLNLVVTSPAGATYLGNAFANGESTPVGSPDAINNTEQVLISAPQPGVWTVRVVGAAVNQGPQGYALLVTGAVSDAGCLGDYNADGNVDQDDVAALVQDIAAGTQSFPPNTPDINADGNADQDDVMFLINLIASTGC
jgi:hypothetical protein